MGVRDGAETAWEARPCGDRSCVWGRPGGMRTNGGCQHMKAGVHETRRILRRMAAELEALREVERAARESLVRQVGHDGVSDCECGRCLVRMALARLDALRGDRG